MSNASTSASLPENEHAGRPTCGRPAVGRKSTWSSGQTMMMLSTRAFGLVTPSMTSSTVPKSRMVSLPPDPTTKSLPDPPKIESPKPDPSGSAAVLAYITSLLDSPEIVSRLNPPWIISFPPKPLMRSLPLVPMRKSAPYVPLMVAILGIPFQVRIVINASLPAAWGAGGRQVFCVIFRALDQKMMMSFTRSLGLVLRTVNSSAPKSNSVWLPTVVANMLTTC